MQSDFIFFMAKQVVLRINGKEVENSFGQLLGITKKLEDELKKLPVGTEAFAKKMKNSLFKITLLRIFAKQNDSNVHIRIFKKSNKKFTRHYLCLSK